MKLITKIVGATLGLAMAIGVGVGVSNYSNKKATMLDAAVGDVVWRRVTSASTLLSGGTFILGHEATAKSGIIIPMANTGSATTSAAGFMYSGASASSGNSDTINMASVAVTTSYEVTIGESSEVDGAIYIKVGNNYLGNTNTKNNCKLFTAQSETTSFTPTMQTNDKVLLDIEANTSGSAYRYLKYNTGSPRFAVYASGQQNPVFYQKLITPGITGSTSGTAGIGVSLTTSATSSTEWSITNNTCGATLSANSGTSITVDAASSGSVTIKAVCAGYTDATHTINFEAPSGSYVVSFNLNAPSGTTTPESIDSQIVDENDYATAPTPAPAREDDENYHYSFGGWFRNAEGTGSAFDFTETPITENVNLFAKWISTAITAKEKIEDRNTTRSSLSYKYDNNTVRDILTREVTGIENGSTVYDSWADKEGSSGAVYAGKSAGDKNTIQLRTKNSEEGIITTTANSSSLKVKRVAITWHGDTSNTRTVDVYGKNSAYSAVTDLYSAEESTQGKLLGSSTFNSHGTSITTYINVSALDEYEYVGIRASDGAVYLSSIEIQWGEASYNYTNVALRFGGILTETLWDTLNTESTILGFGVLLSTDTFLGANTLQSKYEAVDGTNVKKYYNEYKPLSADPDDKPTLFEDAEYNSVTDDYYVWNLRLVLPKTDGKVSNADLKVVYAAVAFVVTEDDGVVFFREERKSAKTLANNMISGPEDNSYDGSLLNLANLA